MRSIGRKLIRRVRGLQELQECISGHSTRLQSLAMTHSVHIVSLGLCVAEKLAQTGDTPLAVIIGVVVIDDGRSERCSQTIFILELLDR